MQRRWLAALAILIVLAALLFWRTRTEDDTDVASARVADAAEPPHRPPREPRRRLAPPPATEEVAGGETSNEPDGSPLFPELRVVVRDSDGAPVRSGRVWASRSVDFVMGLHVADGEIDDDGTCRLRLPKPDTYDVFASDGEMLGAMEAGVRVASDTNVTVTLPVAAELRFVRAEGEPPLQGSATISAKRITPEQMRCLDVASPWIDDREISLAELPLTLRTVAGTRFRYWHAVDPSLATPDVFTAPATVVIRRPPWGTYRLVFSVEPADRVEERDGFVETVVTVEGGGKVDRWESPSGIFDVKRGQRVADVFKFTFEQYPPAAHSTVRWSGRGIRPGSAEIDVPERGVVDVPVVLRLEDGSLPESKIVVRVDGPAGTKGVEAWIVNPEGTADAMPDIADLHRDQEIEFPAGWTPNALVIVAPGLVAEPQRLVVGARHDFTLVRGGVVRVLRGIRPPEGVALMLRRRDRLPIRVDAKEPGSVGIGSEFILGEPKIVLGPFAPGDVALEVTMGPTVVAEMTAHVVAGETTDLRLPFAERLLAR